MGKKCNTQYQKKAALYKKVNLMRQSDPFCTAALNFILNICVGSWENRADVAGSAYQLGRLKVKNKRNFFPKNYLDSYLGVFFTILFFIQQKIKIQFTLEML